MEMEFAAYEANYYKTALTSLRLCRPIIVYFSADAQ